MKHVLLSLFLSVLPASALLSQVQLAWMETNVGTSVGYRDEALAVALDKAGDIYTTGYVYNTGQNSDILTIKRNPAGDTLWTQVFPSSGYDQPFSMVLDDSSCVIVCGYVGDQFSVLKYGPDGVFRWIKKVGVGHGQSVCVDNARNIYATGPLAGTREDIFVIKLSPAGDILWSYTYSGPAGEDDHPYGIAVDQSQNCYVSGESPGGTTNWDFVTIKVNANGTLGWAQRYNGPSNGQDYGKRVAVDASANVYVVGESGVTNKGLDACIVSYTSGGSLRYAKTFGGPSYYDDGFYAVTVDANGSILAAGKIANGPSSTAFYTVKMLPNATGDTVWTRHYTIPGTSYSTPSAIVADPLGKSYVTGQCWASTGDVGVVCLSLSGQVLWSARHDGSFGDNELGYSVAASGNGMVYVAGSSANENSYFDYTLFAYQETGTDVRPGEAPPSEFLLAQNYPNPFNPTTVIEYRVPAGGGGAVLADVHLDVYDLLGREVAVLVDDRKAPGSYTVTLNAAGMPSGIYIYRLRCCELTQSRRMTLIR